MAIPKISEPQYKALELVAESKDNSSFHRSYMNPGAMNLHRKHDISIAALSALVRRGLVDQIGGRRSVQFRITDAGRAVLDGLHS